MCGEAHWNAPPPGWAGLLSATGVDMEQARAEASPGLSKFGGQRNRAVDAIGTGRAIIACSIGDKPPSNEWAEALDVAPYEMPHALEAEAHEWHDSDNALSRSS
jgi:hypothetical protein